jgi:hypothetical protein
MCKGFIVLHFVKLKGSGIPLENKISKKVVEMFAFQQSDINLAGHLQDLRISNPGALSNLPFSARPISHETFQPASNIRSIPLCGIL